MRVLDAYPLFTVARLRESRDFFVGVLGLSVTFEASWVVMLSAGNDRIAIGLMTGDHPARPPGPETFDGQGAIFTLQVEHADAWYHKLVELDVPLLHALTDEAWGQRRFMVRDPSGIAVDIVEQIAPADGFWDEYAAP